MASRTVLMGIQFYDRDGSLDWFYRGSEWTAWRDARLKTTNKETLKAELRVAFERLLTAAFYGVGEQKFTITTNEAVLPGTTATVRDQFCGWANDGMDADLVDLEHVLRAHLENKISLEAVLRLDPKTIGEMLLDLREQWFVDQQVNSHEDDELMQDLAKARRQIRELELEVAQIREGAREDQENASIKLAGLYLLAMHHARRYRDLLLRERALLKAADDVVEEARKVERAGATGDWGDDPMKYLQRKIAAYDAKKEKSE